MKLDEILRISEDQEEKNEKLLAVVYGGRFEPFHKGHFQVYKHLKHVFGSESVWIATSDKTNFSKTNGDISPFNFQEKKELMLRLFRMEEDKIVKCSNPAFNPREIFERYDHAPLVYVAVVGEKDVERYKSAKFFKPYPEMNGHPLPFNEAKEGMSTLDQKVGYYLPVKKQSGGISGTEVREKLLEAADDEHQLHTLFKEFFGHYDEVAKDLIISKLKEVK